MARDETEPSAQHRAAASACWQMFVALCKEGFTEYQALVIVGQVVTAAITKGDGNK